MAAHVNLDALIRREDFTVMNDGNEADRVERAAIGDFAADAFFYQALRKPDFQRETAEWDPIRVVGLIRSFVEAEFIPGVIVWRNRELIFVIDGSHRLSALIAWVQDDYGDRTRSQEFFNHSIPDEQIEVAERTRKLVQKEFGSYEDHRKANLEPDTFPPELVARARRFGSVALKLQWVYGDAEKAENSFVRINQQAAVITPKELELITSRKKPNAIAARAIIRRGTGHQYWGAFSDDTQRQIKDIATEVHSLFFDPPLQSGVKTLDMPAGGPVYSATALRMIYDFITLCSGTASPSNDADGTLTVEYLVRCRRVMRLILSHDRSSMGLSPAVYFYSWMGRQQATLFHVIAAMMIDYERTKTLPKFIERRAAFEEFLMGNRMLIAQAIRKFGSKDDGTGRIRQFYEDVLTMIGQGVTGVEIVNKLIANPAYSYLQPTEVPYGGTSPTRYSSQVKTGLVMRQLLPSAPRCLICHGILPCQAISVDHIKRREDGGQSTPDNAQLTHPYCNTGYKESQRAKGRKNAPL